MKSHPSRASRRRLDRRPLNPRQERFCQAYAACPSAAQAARAAGYAPGGAKHQGWRLLKSAAIRARVRQLAAARARARAQEPAALAGKLEAVYRLALKRRHFHAAARAVELQARLAGLGGRAGASPGASPGATAAAETSSPPGLGPDREDLDAIIARAEAHLRLSAEREAEFLAAYDAEMAAPADEAGEKVGIGRHRSASGQHPVNAA